MSKIKLAICMKDLEYQSRFVGCFMNHYNHLYELHVFTSASQMESSNEREYAVIITGEYNTDELAIFVERGAIILNLEEDFAGEKETEEIVTGIEKYQEVYKIVEQIERLIAERVPGKGNRWQSLKCEMIGVPNLQILPEHIQLGYFARNLAMCLAVGAVINNRHHSAWFEVTKRAIQLFHRILRKLFTWLWLPFFGGQSLF